MATRVPEPRQVKRAPRKRQPPQPAARPQEAQHPLAQQRGEAEAGREGAAPPAALPQPGEAASSGRVARDEAGEAADEAGGGEGYLDPAVSAALRASASVTAANLPYVLYLIPRGTAVLLLGPPGVGKSEAVRAYASLDAASMDGGRQLIEYSDLIERRERLEDVIRNPEKYYVFVDLRLSEMMPEDLIGIPYRRNGYYDYSPPLWAYILSLPGIAGTLFLDELTNVRNDDLLAAAYKIVLERRVGFLALSEDVRVVAAGNPPEFSSIARPLPAPLTNRLMVLRVSPPSVAEWIEYMYQRYEEEWDTRVGAFLVNNEDKLLARDIPAETLENFPTPRAWTDLALTLHMIREFERATGTRVSRKILEEVVRGKVGAAAASSLLGFLEVEPPSIDEVVENPQLLADLIREYERGEGGARLLALWKLSALLFSAASRIRGRLRSEMERLERADEGEREGALMELFSSFVRELRPLLPILEAYAPPSPEGEFARSGKFDRGRELMKVFISALRDVLRLVNRVMVEKYTVAASKGYRLLYPSDLSEEEVERLHAFITALLREYVGVQRRARLFEGGGR